MNIMARIVTVAALCVGFAPMVTAAKQPVKAVKESETDTKAVWTVLVTDENNSRIISKAWFKKNSSFLLGKDNSLFFDFGDFNNQQNHLYVLKGDYSKNIGLGAQALTGLAGSDGKLMEYQNGTKLVKHEDAPAGSSIKIYNTFIKIIKPKKTAAAVAGGTLKIVRDQKSMSGDFSMKMDFSKTGDSNMILPTVVRKKLPSQGVVTIKPVLNEKGELKDKISLSVYKGATYGGLPSRWNLTIADPNKQQNIKISDDGNKLEFNGQVVAPVDSRRERQAYFNSTTTDTEKAGEQAAAPATA